MTNVQQIAKLEEERQFVEEILNERFNFFMVFFSIIAAGAASTSNQVLFRWILSLGAFISVFLTFAIYRSYFKQRILFKQFKIDNPDHAAAWADDEAKRTCKSLFTVVWILGWFIPIVCTVAISIAALLAWLGRLTVISAP